MHQARALLTACLLFTAALAGCVSDEGTNETPAATPSDPDQPTQTASNRLTSTSYRFGPANGSQTLSLDGTFAPTDACLFNACPSGPTTDSLPITETLTEGQPVLVNASLTWEPSGPGNIGLDLQQSEVETRSVYWSTATASVTFTGILIQQPGGEASFQVSYQNPESPNDVSYSLTVTTTTLTTQIPAEIPTRVNVPAPANALTVTPTDTVRTLRIWTPTDTYLGETTLKQGETTLPLPGASGAYIVLATADSGSVQLAVPNTSAPLEPLTLLGLEYTYGDSTALSPEGSASFEFAPDRVPVRVGLYYRPQQVAQSSADTQAGEEGSISTPNKTLLSFGGEGGVSVSAGGVDTWVSSASIEPESAGTWTGQFAADAITPGEVGPLLVHYERPG